MIIIGQRHTVNAYETKPRPPKYWYFPLQSATYAQAPETYGMFFREREDRKAEAGGETEGLSKMTKQFFDFHAIFFVRYEAFIVELS